MPKSKPTQVILHRVEFNEKERDMLETIVVGKTVKNVVVPAAITAGVVSATYLGYKYGKATYDWGDDIVDNVKDSYAMKALKFGHKYNPATHIARGIYKFFGFKHPLDVFE